VKTIKINHAQNAIHAKHIIKEDPIIL